MEFNKQEIIKLRAMRLFRPLIDDEWFEKTVAQIVAHKHNIQIIELYERIKTLSQDYYNNYEIMQYNAIRDYLIMIKSPVIPVPLKSLDERWVKWTLKDILNQYCKIAPGHKYLLKNKYAKKDVEEMLNCLKFMNIIKDYKLDDLYINDCKSEENSYFRYYKTVRVLL